MRYKRQETFRYQFEVPVVCSYRILKIDHKEITSKPGEGFIYDISEGGLKLTSPLFIPIENKNIELEIIFKLNQAELTITGVLVWSKENFNKQYSYGIQFTIEETIQRQLIEELKIYTKGIVVIKKKRT